MTARLLAVAAPVFFSVGTTGPLQAGAQTNKALVQRVVDEIWNRGNLDLTDELFAPDFVNDDPNPGAATDLNGYEEWVARWRSAFPDFHIEVHDLVAERNKVAARLTATGTHQGDFLGIPATSTRVTMKIINLYRLDSGRVVEVYRSYDLLGLGQQLGYFGPLPEEVFPFSFARRTDPGDFAWGDPSEAIGDPGHPESNKALCVQEIEEGWNQGDAAAALGVVAPTFVFHSIYPEVTDFESYREWIEGHIDPDDPTQIAIHDLIAEGDRVADLSAADLGEGLAEEGIRISRFAGGKMVEMWRNLNVLPVLIGMGLLPTFPGVEGGSSARVEDEQVIRECLCQGLEQTPDTAGICPTFLGSDRYISSHS